jgi:hypothetical protein
MIVLLLCALLFQAKRFGALRITGFGVEKAELDTFYTRQMPDANGLPHYSNGKNSYHLYKHSGNQWCISNTFEPATTKCCASITGSAVPVGSHIWQYFNGKTKTWESSELTVTELSAGEATAARQAAQAVVEAGGFAAVEQAARCGGLRLSGFDGADRCGLYTRCSPDGNNLPHYSNENGYHLFVLRMENREGWCVRGVFDPIATDCTAITPQKAVLGAVPVGECTWEVSLPGKTWVDRSLTVTEVGVAEAAAERAVAQAVAWVTRRAIAEF